MLLKLATLFTGLTMAVSSAYVHKDLSAEDLLAEALSNSIEIVSEEVDTKFVFNMEVDSDSNSDSSLSVYEEYLSDIELDLHMKSNMATKKEGEVEGNIDFQGMSFEFQGYMNNEQIALKIPMESKYYIHDFTDDFSADMFLINAQFMNQLIGDTFFKTVQTDALTVDRHVERKINDTAQEVNIVNIELDDATAKSFIKAFVIGILESDDFLDYLYSQSELSQEYSSKSDMVDDIEDLRVEFESSWDEVAEIFEVKKVHIALSLDKDNNILKTEAAIELVIDSSLDEEVYLSLTMDSNKYNINENLDISYPRITAENSMPLSDLYN